MKTNRVICRLALVGALFACCCGCQTAHKPAGIHPADTGAVPAATLQRGMTLAELTGGDLGMGGGFLIAASPDKVRSHDSAKAVAAAHQGEESPAGIDQAHQASTADLNHDGFVTLDEVMAMARAGMTDDEMIDRLRKTGYLFQVTPQQERYLGDRGISAKVVSALHELSLQKQSL